ncbi:hypothetical protein F511_29044 [Dorcoceras hygrometricum]|uniref:Uncharacterized protein n=1 Tax=Dorcoceras hygrometricum TaxID=472368 RepID=A0A2Z7CBD2_9LAMI|nr:hypothetical protein F511_29044 [Dorcoceras hygrometricum]
MMVAISSEIKINWAHVLFQTIAAMVSTPGKQSQGSGAQRGRGVIAGARGTTAQAEEADKAMTEQSAQELIAALATRTELNAVRNAHPKAHASRRTHAQTFLKSFELQQLHVSTPALIQRLNWVANERAKQGKSSATKIVKNKGWMRWKSAVENHGE